MRFLDACVIVKHFRLCVMGTWNGAGGERRVERIRTNVKRKTKKKPKPKKEFAEVCFRSPPPDADGISD
jgi:hypothetical protein